MLNTAIKPGERISKPKPHVATHVMNLAENFRKFNLKHPFPFPGDGNEIIKKVKIINRLGFNLKVAAQFVKATSKFKCLIQVKGLHDYANGKSLLNLMTLMGSCGSELTLKFNGRDARVASRFIQELFLNNFGDPEYESRGQTYANAEKG